MKVLDLWQQSFHPGCQKNFLGVYMNSLRDVGIRRDITWREIFFEPWLKNFDLFLITAFCVSKGTFLVKKIFFESSVFFSNFPELWKNIYRAWRKSFGQGYQNWKLQSSSQKINQKTKLLKVLFLFKLSRTLNEQVPCLAKKFWAGMSKLKIVLYVFRVSCWG